MSSNPASSAPVDPDTPVFIVGWEGGFVAPVTNVSRLPIIVVYGDGRVITQGPQIEIWPSPLVPNLQEQTLSADALARLVALAREKGLLTNAHFDFVGIADAPDTVLTINLDGQTFRVSAYALAEAGELNDGRGMDAATRAGRAALREFIDALTAVPASEFVDESHPYQADVVRLYVTAAAVVDDPELGAQPIVDWPLADLATAGTQIGDPSLGVRCVEVSGDDLSVVMPLLERANVITPFRSGGSFYNLVVRPDLPHEAGC